MKKLILLWLISVLSLSALELNSEATYAAAQKRAQNEHKNIMALVIQEGCQYCEKLMATTLKDDAVIEAINRDYIFVVIDRHNDVYPKSLVIMGAPTTFFLYNDGSKIMRGVIGYWSSEDFLSFMKDAAYKIKKGKK